MPEGVFQATDEHVGALTPDHLRITLPGMAQDAAEQMRPSSSAFLDNPCAAAEVDLKLLAGGALHPAKRRVDGGRDPTGEALDRLIAAVETVVGDKILVDPFERQP